MVDTLFLPAESNSLVIETNADGWSKCFLIERERIYLGADDFSVIAMRLREGFRKHDLLDSPIAGEINGFPVVWLLSLSEAHHCLYVADAGDRTLLFWENAHKTPVTLAGVMCLSPEQREQWQETLSTVMGPEKTPALAA